MDWELRLDELKKQSNEGLPDLKNEGLRDWSNERLKDFAGLKDWIWRQCLTTTLDLRK